MVTWGHALARGDVLARGHVGKGKRQGSKGAAEGDRIVGGGIHFRVAGSSHRRRVTGIGSSAAGRSAIENWHPGSGG